MDTEIRMQVDAGKLLTALAPIVAVAGKEAEVTAILEKNKIRCVVKDEPKTMQCHVEAYPLSSDSSFVTYEADEEPTTITFALEHLTAALKPFGSEAATIALVGSRVCLWNDSRRRSFTLLGFEIPEAKEPRLVYPFDSEVPASRLKELVGLEKMGETVHMFVDKGRLVMRCTSDVETAEVFVATMYTLDVRSAFGSALLSQVIKAIPSDDVTVRLGDDIPLRLDFDYGCADYRVYIAPRIEGV